MNNKSSEQSCEKKTVGQPIRSICIAILYVVLIASWILVWALLTPNRVRQASNLDTAGQDQPKEFVNQWKLQRTFEKQNAGLWSVAFSPAGDHVVAGCHDGTAHVWDFHSGQVLKSLNCSEGPVYQASFSPDGKLLLTAGRPARIWDASGFELVFTLPVDEAVFTLNGKFVFCYGDQSSAYNGGYPVSYWSLETGKELDWNLLPPDFGKTDGKYYSNKSNDFRWQSSDKSLVAYRSLNDTDVYIMRGSETIGKLKFRNREELCHLAWAPGNQHIVTVGMDGIPRVWASETHR